MSLSMRGVDVRLPLKSPMVAAWLFIAAFLVVAMVCVGGVTRLTESGLSITEWKPVSGVIPPTSDTAWQDSFAKYKQIPQYRVMNAHMTLSQYKGIFWWEWSHRLLARVLGAIYVLGFVAFLLMRKIPARLIWRCAVLVALIGCEAGIGWWMVSSGVDTKTLIAVAPERLMTHLSISLLLLTGSVWTGLEANNGEGRGRGAPFAWKTASGILLGIVFLQCLLGALVAGNRAGLVYNDFPMMNGQFFPPFDWSKGVGYSFLHDQGLVQFMHRLNAYVLLIYVISYAVILVRKCQDDGIKTLAAIMAVLVCIQAALGVATLISVVDIHFAFTHQLVAVCLVILAASLTWKVARADRVFRSSGF